MTTFFVSDNHFWHRRVSEFCPNTRRGSCIEETNELMIEAHNEVVRKNDLVYFLGDFSFGTAQQTLEIVSRLNGAKHLIYGNHDKVIRGDASIQRKFVTVQDYKRVSVDKIGVVLFHFPMREWEQCHRGYYHLHGHVHGSMNNAPHGRSMDVGIDARSDNLMQPWSWEEIHQRLKDQPIISHH